jgi:hypothetical protein
VQRSFALRRHFTASELFPRREATGGLYPAGLMLEYLGGSVVYSVLNDALGGMRRNWPVYGLEAT